MTQLVFLEGVSGVGKSTMTRRLAEDLRGLGYRARPYVESDCTNPIDFYRTACLTPEEYRALCQEAPSIREHAIPAGTVRLVRYYDRDTPLFEEPLLSRLAEREFCYQPARPIPLEAYTAACAEVWKAFAASIDESADFLLFDGSLLHHPINDMLRNYHLTGEQAVPPIRALLRALGRRRRHIVYLKSGDVGGQLQRARQARGQSPPTPEQIAFWETRFQTDQTVLQSLDEPYRSYDISGERWDAARREILSILTEELIPHVP